VAAAVAAVVAVAAAVLKRRPQQQHHRRSVGGQGYIAQKSEIFPRFFQPFATKWPC
jgi:hypothetical protein